MVFDGLFSLYQSIVIKNDIFKDVLEFFFPVHLVAMRKVDFIFKIMTIVFFILSFNCVISNGAYLKSS